MLPFKIENIETHDAVYVQKEVEEMQRIMEREKEQIKRTQQKAMNQVQADCAKVVFKFFPVKFIDMLSNTLHCLVRLVFILLVATKIIIKSCTSIQF